MKKFISDIPSFFSEMMKDLLSLAFSRDTSVYDEEVAKKIFSDKDNTEKLLSRLDEKNEQYIEIKFNENQKLEIVD